MSKKTIAKKAGFSKNLSKQVERALLYLTNPRVREIIERRFGLRDGQGETLEAIGKDYGITRERIRQLEENGLKVLKSEKVLSLLNPVFQYFDDLFSEHGQIMGEDYLYGLTTGTNEVHPLRGQIYLVLTLGDSYQRVVRDERFYPHWMSDASARQKAEKIVDFLIDHFNKNNKVLQEKEVMDLLSKKHSNLPEKLFCVVLDISKEIEKNIFKEIGLSHWSEITPQGVKDRAYLVLKRETEPRHFTTIAELINKTFSDRPTYTQTVHNELIKDPRFVLVGRGLYALGDWGYEQGTVEDVIKKILSQTKKPMARKEIIDAVLAKRLVRPNTIILNLHRSPKIQRMKDGKYILA